MIDPLSCSFCGKSRKEVRVLIAGPTVYICDECIELCNDILAEKNANDALLNRKVQGRPGRVTEHVRR